MKRPFFFVKIEGESMWPNLVPGRKYIATNLLKPKVGDCVVFNPPVYPDRNVGAGGPENAENYFIKKVNKIIGNKYFVGGTVSWSSSHQISKESIVGKLITFPQ